MTPVSHGKPCAGNPHARFDEGAPASEKPRRNALLHSGSMIALGRKPTGEYYPHFESDCRRKKILEANFKMVMSLLFPDNWYISGYRHCRKGHSSGGVFNLGKKRS